VVVVVKEMGKVWTLRRSFRVRICWKWCFSLEGVKVAGGGRRRRRRLAGCWFIWWEIMPAKHRVLWSWWLVSGSKPETAAVRYLTQI
jgi:hypothetical protein